ncbi:carotenoid biosynthesis protein [Mycobacterium sp. pR1184]|uniref:carotenoid biosynthesis protein n=1 Tax=Mycobacterium sp. pR1184 TaxID=3238981 RepID=UPI00351B56B9
MKIPTAFCWVLLILTLLAAVVMAVWPALTAQAGAAQMGFLILFVVVHAWLGYSARGMVAFVLIACVIAFALEAIGVATGFPFGSYVHHLPGPKPLGVPPVAVASWLMFGWLAWALARVIIRAEPAVADGGAERFTTPVVATFILGGYDLVYDPIGATAHDWYSYDHPTGALGVPLTNFLGWLLTGWLIFQIAALVETRFPARPVTSSRSYWLLPCLFWLSTATQVFAGLIHPTAGAVVRGGKTIRIADVYESGASAALFTIVCTGIIALVRLYSRRASPR